MAEDIISELRKILQEVIVPDLKLLVAKIDDLQRRIELSNKAVEARYETLRLEVEAMRAEMNKFRAGSGSQQGLRVQAGPQENSANGEEQSVRPVGGGKQWVN